MAAFVNSVYLLFSFVFNFVDNLHHMVEHWEVDSHNSNSTSSVKSIHDDVAHLKEVNQYLTLFTFLKLAIIGAYLYFEARHHDVTDYMQVNWLGWPKNIEDDRLLVKAKVKQCVEWDSFRVNTYSIALLMGCEFINCFGNLWVYWICVNFGILENLLSLMKGMIIVILAVPLCLDICFTLLQKVNPWQLVPLLEDKLKTIAYIEGVISVKKWHLWCLDKSYRVCTIHVEVSESSDADQIRTQIEKKLLNKYCESLTVHIS